MFTGIIEEIGSIANIQQTGETIVLTVTASKVLEDVQLGDSIAVNGVCLTVTAYSKTQFNVDVMPETVRATSLHYLNRGSKVNLERAMSAGGRFGGHFVSGHVDGLGHIKNIRPHGNAVYYEIEVGPELMSFIMYKGSITVDGTSLTVFDLTDKSFTISLIPHTRRETVIGLKSIGETVNIECDMLGKYIHHFLAGTKAQDDPKRRNITAEFLEENGFK
jgi:riboflavin synthase